MASYPRVISRGPLKGETYTTRHEYREALYQHRGAKSEADYRNQLAESRGYKNEKEERALRKEGFKPERMTKTKSKQEKIIHFRREWKNKSERDRRKAGERLAKELGISQYDMYYWMWLTSPK